MLDKDFDQFFKSSLEEVEITPSQTNWSEISNRLDAKSNKRNFSFWMAAASILIVFGIGIGLYHQTDETIKLHPDENQKMTANLAKDDAPVLEAKPQQKDMGVGLSKKTPKPIRKAKPNSGYMEGETDPQSEEEPIVPNKQQVVYTQSVQTLKTPRVKLVTEQILQQEELKKVGAVSLEEDEDEFASLSNSLNPNTKRLKITSLGDIVNFVVGKVDKREEKIIRISKTTESDNEVTGINLGLFKFSKQD